MTVAIGMASCNVTCKAGAEGGRGGVGVAGVGVAGADVVGNGVMGAEVVGAGVVGAGMDVPVELVLVKPMVEPVVEPESGRLVEPVGAVGAD